MIFKKKKKKSHLSSIYVILDSVLEELDSWWRAFTSSISNNDKNGGKAENDVSEQIMILRMEIRLLRTFVICAANWIQDTDKRVDQLEILAMDLQSAFKKARKDFKVVSCEKAYRRRYTDYLYPAISKLQEKITHYRPRIKEAYFYAAGYSFEFHLPICNYDLWVDLAMSLSDDLFQLGRQGCKLPATIMPQLFSLREMIGCLMPILYHVKEEHGFVDVLAYFGTVLVRGAHISYLCWVDRMDENMTQDLTTKLFDVLEQFRPNTLQVLDLCLKFLKVENSSSCQVEILVDVLISQKNLLPTRRKAMVRKLESFGYTCSPQCTVPDRAKGADRAIFEVIEKTELLNAEQFLLELLYGRIPGKSFIKERIDSFHDGLSFLQTSQGNCEIPKPVWTHIRPVAMDAASIYLSFLDGNITEDKATNELSKLHGKIKLFEIEIFLRDLVCNQTNVIINVKNHIKTLYEGLMVLRTFLMGPLEENGKLILEHVESETRDILSIYCSFHATEVTEDKVREFMSLLPKLVERIEQLSADIKNIYILVRNSLKSNFPKTHGFGFIDFLSENLRELVNSKFDSIASMTDQIQFVQREIGSLRSLFGDFKSQFSKHSELKSLVSHILEVAYEAEYIVDSFSVRDGVAWYHTLWLSDLIEDIKLIKMEASEISKKTQGPSIGNIPQALRKVISPATVSDIDEVVVELSDEKKLMIDRLTKGSLQLDVVSIVGMPGIGKTTLAKKVYNDPLVTYHFHICAWCCVSQVYQKRKLLLEILGNIVELTDSILEMSEADLDMELYKCLKRRRYLIVMDDMWNIEAWNELERSFPNDKYGSRILITSRLTDVVSKTKAGSIPHPLRLLSQGESWDLLKKKLFHRKDCPKELEAVGKQIAQSCGGLPLAVVAISGLLERTEMKPDWWKQVAETLCTHIAEDPERTCMDILELSYKHLPDYLKPCFLYLGAFFEDKEIPVRKLTWLWVAEGFIQNTQLQSVEDLAEEYLRDLIGRSMVIASRRRSFGGVKTCRVHDLLRTLCLQKCKEERFLQQVTGFDKFCSTSYDDSDYGVDPGYTYPANSSTYETRRLSIYSKRNHFVMSRPSGPIVRSLLYSARTDFYPRRPYNISFIPDNFKLLNVLDLECINMGNSFPSGIDLLVHLRFLALCGDIDYIPVSIANLRKLETLLIKALKGRILVPDTVWGLAKLRHLHVNNIVALSFQDSSKLENLVSLSCPCLFCEKGTENIMRRLPKLRKLRCLFMESRDNVGNSNQFPILDFLTELESLNILYSGRIVHPCKFNFPLRLKKLTLSKFRLPWDSISEIGRLPNLEVLKLLSRSFEGKIWDMKEGEFPKLKFLKLDTLNIAQWNASCDSLPTNLQHLVLRSCRQLEEVPSAFGDIYTLEMIEVQLCRHSVEESVRRLRDEQLELGNEDLKVLISRSDWDF